jgi:hypothetical protein
MWRRLSYEHKNQDDKSGIIIGKVRVPLIGNISKEKLSEGYQEEEKRQLTQLHPFSS